MKLWLLKLIQITSCKLLVQNFVPTYAFFVTRYLWMTRHRQEQHYSRQTYIYHRLQQNICFSRYSRSAHKSASTSSFSSSWSLQTQDSVNTSMATSFQGTHETNDQCEAICIAKTFVPTEFRPHPLLNNCHLQTILATYFRLNKSLAYIHLPLDDTRHRRQLFLSRSIRYLRDTVIVLSSTLSSIASELIKNRKHSHFDVDRNSLSHKPCNFWDERQRIETPDGDFYHVDYKWCAKDTMTTGTRGFHHHSSRHTLHTPTQNILPYQLQNCTNLVIMLHGLESSSNSSLSIDMATAFMAEKFDVACINFRGCSGVPTVKWTSGYHAGFTDDLIHFMTLIKQQYSGVDAFPLFLSGVSLGANVVVKCLGDLGDSAIHLYNIQGAAVTGCPFDLNVQYKQLVRHPWNRFVYTGTLLRSLKRKARFILHHHCDGDEDTTFFDYKKCSCAQTIADIEEGLIVRLFDFQSVHDYYNKSASISVMHSIVVPTIIINSEDDPFLNPHYFPWDYSCDHGGTAPIKFIRTKYGGHLGYMFHVVDTKSISTAASWISTELGRFLNHTRHIQHRNSMRNMIHFV